MSNPEELARLARLAEEDPAAAAARLADLEPEVRNEVLRATPARRRLDVILSSREPAAVTRALAPTDLFFTFHEIGADDALELVQLASDEQVGFLIDLECWQRGRLTPDRLDRWITRLADLGPDELSRAVAHMDLELLVSYLHRRMTVFKRDEDTDAAEISDPSFRTLDDLYYFAFPGAAPDEERKLSSLVGLVRERDLQRYLDLLESVMAGLPSATEADALRLRDGRMLDQGFPDYDSALGLYAYVDPREFDPARHAKAIVPSADATVSAGAELEPLRVAGEFFLTDVLSSLDASEAAPIREELAYLVHRAMVTEVEDVTRLEELRDAARDVVRYVSLGLEHLAGGDPAAARSIALGTRLEAVLRLGYGLTMVLRHRRDALLAHPGFARIDDPEGRILGSPISEALSALARPRPAYAVALDEPLGTGRRPFRVLEEVVRVGALLTQAEALTALTFGPLAGSGSSLERWPRGTTVAELITTAMAHAVLGEAPTVAPLPANRLDELHAAAFGSPPGRPPRLDPERLAPFERWLDGALAELPEAWAMPTRRFVEHCAARLEEELGPVDPSVPIDPRFVDCLWLGAPKT